MNHTQQQGNTAELAALDYLHRHGLRLVQRNFRCRAGELDLIMTEGDTLVFVEVRYRANARFGSGADSVDRRKQRKMIRAAEFFLGTSRAHRGLTCRFDVVSASELPASPTRDRSGETMTLEWIRGAFDTDEQ